VIIINIYRSPTGNFKHFLNKPENILNSLHRNKNEMMIICGDINVNYLVTSHRRQQLDMLLSTYNLINSVQFPTRILNVPSTAIDSIFIDKMRRHGLSDHNAQEI
jgi:exonuclease III